MNYAEVLRVITVSHTLTLSLGQEGKGGRINLHIVSEKTIIH